MSAVIVIPARYGSTRLPGKPLLLLCGKPLIQWVYERASQSRLATQVRVATDDERILRAVRMFGGEAVMTRADHPSGTDRIAEAVRDTDADVVINVQGDEPLIEPELIDALVETFASPGDWDMATAASPVCSEDDLRNHAVVKVVWGEEHRALYFSREPIPHIRDARDVPTTLSAKLRWRHIGIYGYRRAFLEKLVNTPPSPLEQAEKLEQLRALHIGARMKVLETTRAGLGVDTPDDISRAESALRAAGLA